MLCPQCGYAMDAFQQECPRCKRLNDQPAILTAEDQRARLQAMGRLQRDTPAPQSVEAMRKRAQWTCNPVSVLAMVVLVIIIVVVIRFFVIALTGPIAISR